jgi:predicted lipoprotein with Yx(FWY)xxD motif
MRRITMILIPTLLSAGLLAACGSSSSSPSSSSAAAGVPASAPTSGTAVASVVKTASNAAVGGTVLVDSRGLTLYHLTGEQNGKWICTSAACLHAWPPLTVKTGAAPKGSVGSLGTVTRPDGTVQVTYKGMPLYTFIKDTKPGQAMGQGIKDVGTWLAVTTSTAAASAQPAAPAPATSTTAPATSSSGGAYSY